VHDGPVFSLAQALPSRPSVGDFSPLFGPFAGTPAWSDSSATSVWVVRPAPSPTGLLLRAERRGGLPVLARGVSWRARVPTAAPGSLAARVSAANDVAFPFWGNRSGRVRGTPAKTAGVNYTSTCWVNFSLKQKDSSPIGQGVRRESLF